MTLVNVLQSVSVIQRIQNTKNTLKNVQIYNIAGDLLSELRYLRVTDNLILYIPVCNSPGE